MSAASANPPLRILHIASGDLWAGAEVQVFTLLAQLRLQSDVEVAAIVLNPGELAQRLQQQGVRTWVLNEAQQSGLSIFWAMHRAMREFAPQIVHTHRQKENVLGAIAAASLGIPSVRTAHGADEHTLSLRQPHKLLFRRLDAFVAAQLQRRVIAVSTDLAQILRTSWPRARFEVIDNVVDAAALRVRAALYAAPEGVHASTRIGIVGRLVPVKRVDLFIAVAAELQGRHIEGLQFEIIGDGPLHAALAQQAAQADASIRLHGFVKDPVPELARLRVLLITSDHEGLPTAALEALALGVPVVSRAVGGLPALAAAGADCTLVASDSPAAIADAVETVLQRAVAAEHALPERFSAPFGAARLLQLYRELL